MRRCYRSRCGRIPRAAALSQFCVPIPRSECGSSVSLAELYHEVSRPSARIGLSVAVAARNWSTVAGVIVPWSNLSRSSPSSPTAAGCRRRHQEAPCGEPEGVGAAADLLNLGQPVGASRAGGQGCNGTQVDHRPGRPSRPRTGSFSASSGDTTGSAASMPSRDSGCASMPLTDVYEVEARVLEGVTCP